jgi:hypothetical protein
VGLPAWPGRSSMTVRRILAALAFAALVWVGARQLGAVAQTERESWPKTADTLLVPPAELVPFAGAVLGREVMGDVVWARMLVYYGSNWAGEGDLSQLEPLIDVVMMLAPRFKPVYEFAAYATTYKGGTATQEEFQTSIRYLERAMKAYPDDYKYFWIAGLRYYYDLWSKDEATRRGNRERGAALIEEAMRKPNAPPDLATTAASMRSKLGQHQRAIDSLRQMVLITDNQEAREKMLARLRVESPDLAEEVERAADELEERWQLDMPSVPLDLYILLGPPPPRIIDFRQLATPHDLFGIEAEEPAAESGPSPPPAPSPPAADAGELDEEVVD